jgi:hypothetical protein
MRSPPAVEGGHRASLSADVLAALNSLPPMPPRHSPSKNAAAAAGASNTSRAARGTAAADSVPPTLLQFLGGGGGDDPDGPGDDSDGDSEGDFDPADPFGVLGKARRVRRARSHRSDLEDDAEAAGHTSYMARDFICNVLRSSGGTSVHRVFKGDVKFHNERNRRECLALARIIDAALRSDLKQLLELAVRRLAGVHTADTSDNNWDACDAIEQVMERQSFVPTKHLQRALKTVVQMQALQQKEHHGAKGKQAQSQHNKGKRGGGDRASPHTGSGSGAAAQPGKKPAAASGGSDKA